MQKQSIRYYIIHTRARWYIEKKKDAPPKKKLRYCHRPKQIL